MKASEAREKLNKLLATTSSMKKVLPLIEAAIQRGEGMIHVTKKELKEEEVTSLEKEWGYKVRRNWDNSGNGIDRSDQIISYTIEW